MKISTDMGRVTVKTEVFSSAYTGETKLEILDDGSVVIHVIPSGRENSLVPSESAKVVLASTKDEKPPRHGTETLRAETYELTDLYRRLGIISNPPRRFPPGESVMKTEIEKISSRFLRTTESTMVRLSNICFIVTNGKEGLRQGHEAMTEAVNDWLHNKKKFFKELKNAKAMIYKP
jgi:hypothetical protein